MNTFGLSFFLLACSDDPKDTGSDTADSQNQELSFMDKDFILESSEGFDPVSSPIRLSFKSNPQEVSFHAGCNGHTGEFSLDGDVLTLSSMYATEIGCSEDLMEQDMWLADLFMSGPTLEHNADQVIVTGNGATLTFIDEDIAIPDQPLSGITWIVDTYIDGEIASAYNLDEPVTMEFSDDGQFEIHTGCNGMGGTYSTSGDDISFALEDMSLIGCNDPLNTIEEHLLSVLSDSASFNIDGNRLTVQGSEKGISAFAEE